MPLKLLMLLAMCLGQGFFICALGQLDTQLPYVSGETVVAYQDNIHGRKKPHWYLINVLPDDVCRECSIPGSINIPVHKLQKKLFDLKKWPRDRKIILYCAGGNCPLSRYAYEIVTKLGFDDVQILAGGIAAWAAHKLPLKGSCALEYLKQ